MPGEPTKKAIDEANKRAFEAMARFMEQEGMGGRYLAQRLKEKTVAKETQTAKFKGHIAQESVVRARKNGGSQLKSPRFSGEVRILAESKKGGETVIAWEEEAHDIQLRALDMAFRLGDYYPPEEKRIAGPGGGPIPIQRLEVEFVKSNPTGGQKREN
jgi:hypothetical protein